MNRRLFLPMGLLLLASAGPVWIEPVWSKAPACPAYEQLQPQLNSERIRSCFGSYGIDVIHQDGQLRVSSLYSLDGEERITRTLAISEFASDLPASLSEAYQAIRAGASMGATLEDAGWRVDKRLRYLGEVRVRGDFRCMPDLTGDDLKTLAVQVYDLWVLREEQEVRFALLAELHDPRYLTLQDIQQIYSTMNNELQPHDPDSGSLLQQAMSLCQANE